MDKKSIIIGAGEVGSSLREVIGGDLHDPQKELYAFGYCDFLHICFPYHDNFVNNVMDYQNKFSAGLTIIHSTVPIGTSRKCCAIHSPIRGVHPHLAEGIRTFVKFFGGTRAREAADYFEQFDIETITTENAEDTEAMKLWDTTQYGLMILINRHIKKWCDENKVDFNIVYTWANQTYNSGYNELGRPEVARPYLKYTEGPIGGHCVRQNAHLLDKHIAQMLEESR